MAERDPRILVIGYGNRGRGDDALGPMLADAVAALSLPSVTVQIAHQLQVEDAVAVAAHDAVIFADADVAADPPYAFRAIAPRAEPTVTTHSVPPGQVLGLAHELFAAAPLGFVLAIRGYRFDTFDEELSDGARANLAAALATLEPILRCRGLDALSAAVPMSAVAALGP